MGQRPDILGHAFSRDVVFGSGSVATPRRTVLGVLAHVGRLELHPDAIGEFLVASGLPSIALEEPDIHITLDQELACLAHILRHLDGTRSVHGHALALGLDTRITHFGMLGLALLHASSALECARVVLAYPELAWGHSRVRFALDGDGLYQSFVVESRVPGIPPEEAARVREYAATVDLTVSIKLFSDVLGPGHGPLAVWLPYPAPPDHLAMAAQLGVPIRFDAPEARVYFPPRVIEATPALANPVAFRAYERLAAQLSSVLRTEVTLAEQVRRILFRTTPPPDREGVARRLAMSTRTLSRKLRDEGTSFSSVLREVRLARSQELLGSGSVPLEEVAARLGFSDGTAFSRAFRGWTGASPSAWRRGGQGGGRSG